MKLQILSDIHLEFADLMPVQTDADVIILAGDIGKSSKGLEWARQSFPHQEIVVVAGNHEHYGSDMLEERPYCGAVAEQLGIHLLENQSVVVGDTRFLGATLWTDFRLFGYDQEWFAIQAGQRGLNDFRLIREGGKPFTARRSQELHEASLKWLQHAIAEPHDGKTVVVSHHLPSMLSVADRFKQDLLSACFASNLDDLFGRMELWIHGHTHECFDYSSEGTRVICNPRGYPRENAKFDSGKVVDI